MRKGAAMANNNAVSDEEIIAALLTSGTVKAAARAIGITERTIYNRMTDGEFQLLYRSAKTDILRQALHKLNAHTAAAIDTISEIMYCEDNNPATRLQAAQTLLGSAEKFTSRLTAAEQAVINQKESNTFWNL